MPHAVSITCPHCNAPHSGKASPAGICECSFCGTTFSILATMSPFVGGVRPAQGLQPPAPQPAPRPRAGRVLIGIAGIFVAIGLIGAVAWLRTSGFRRGYSPSRPRISIPRVTIPSVTATPPEAPPELKPTAEFTYHRSVRPAYGTAQYIYGVVKNTGRVAIDKPKIIVVLRDASGKELDTKSGYAERELLPGESSPVQVLITNPPAHASLDFETVVRKAFVEPRRAAGLRLETRPPERNMIGSVMLNLAFKGKVHNEGKETARFVRILVTALDEEGKIVGLAYSYVEGERLAPGSAGRYEVMAHFSGKPAKFELSVEGRPE